MSSGLRTTIQSLIGLAIFAALLFAPAATLNNWQAWVGLLLVIPTLILLAIRIADEERMLVDELAGYAQNRQQVRYRFLPYIW